MLTKKWVLEQALFVLGVDHHLSVMSEELRVLGGDKLQILAPLLTQLLAEIEQVVGNCHVD
jgi:hypothetical protein